MAAEEWVMVVYPTTDPAAVLHRALDGEPPESSLTLYLVTFDPDGNNGMGAETFTTDLAQAKRYAGFMEVMEEWKRPSTVRPLRDDGKPNRPLTAYSINPRKVTTA